MAIGDFSNLVTNPQMKKVLSDVAHLSHPKLGSHYKLTKQARHKCTSGPATWYRRAGIHLTFWNGAQPYAPGHANYKRGKRSATVKDMKASLLKSGFQIVWSGTGQDANTKLASLGILRPGDVATMLSSNSAHAAMWTGQDWRSDFLQDNKPYPYSLPGRGGNETFILWRHPKLQDDTSNETPTQTVKPTKQAAVNTPSNNEIKQNTNQSKVNMSTQLKWRSERPKETTKYGVPKDRTYINDNAMAFISFLVNKGIPLEAAFGVAGNIMNESGFNPYNQDNDDNNTGQPSGGLAMWHAGRFTKLKDFAKKKGKNWEDIETQMEFLWSELNGNYKNVLAKLKKTTDMDKASYIWGNEYEKFVGYDNWNSDGHKARRQNAADFKKEYNKRGYNFSQQSTNNTPQDSNPTIEQLEAEIDEDYKDALAAIEKSEQKFMGKIDNSNDTPSITDKIPQTFYAQESTEIPQGTSRGFDLDFIRDYSEDNNIPGNTHIDYYTPYRNYVSTLPLHLQTGGSLKQKYTIEDTEEHPKSYLISPTGPFRLPTTALNFDKIIKALFNRRNKATQENVLSTLYDTTLRMGGKIKKHQEGSSIEKTLSQKEQAKLFKKKYIEDLEFLDPIYSTKEEDELLDQYYEQYYKIKQGLATYIDNEYKEVDKPILNPDETPKRTNWEPDYYINQDSDLYKNEPSYNNSYTQDDIYYNEDETTKENVVNEDVATEDVTKDNSEIETNGTSEDDFDILSDKELNGETQDISNDYENDDIQDNIESAEYNNSIRIKNQFIWDFVHDDNIIKKFNVKAVDDDYETVLNRFKSRIQKYIKDQMSIGVPVDQIYDEILEESPNFKEFLYNGLWTAGKNFPKEPDYNLRNPYEGADENSLRELRPVIEIYSLLLDSWKNSKK